MFIPLRWEIKGQLTLSPNESAITSLAGGISNSVVDTFPDMHRSNQVQEVFKLLGTKITAIV